MPNFAPTKSPPYRPEGEGGFGKQMNDLEKLIENSLARVITPIITKAVRDAMKDAENAKPKYGATMDLQQLCDLTGYSRQTIYQKSSNGEIPGIRKSGAKLRFDTATVLEWVRFGCPKNGGDRP